MRSRYNNQGGADGTGSTEALHNEADTAFSGDATAVAHAGTDPFAGTTIVADALVESAASFKTGRAGTTAEGEALGDGVSNNMGTGGHFNQMAFSIERTRLLLRPAHSRQSTQLELVARLESCPRSGRRVRTVNNSFD